MIYYGQELYHHGIKGQRWGVRRYQNEDGTLTPAGKKRYEYSEAKLNYKNAKIENRNVRFANKPNPIALGINGINKEKEKKENIKKSNAKLSTMYAKKEIAKAKYKSEKTKSSNKSNKEFNSYVRSMVKTGLPGSAMDEYKNNKSTALYNQLNVEKGKQYADKVQKKVEKKIFIEGGSAAIASIGLTAVAAYLNYKY